MPHIQVKNELKVRFNEGGPLRVFAPGKHKLTDEELQHWYIQGAIKSERAHQLPDAAADEPEAKEGEGNDGEVVLVNKSELEAAETKLAAELGERGKAEAKLAAEVTARENAETKLADEITAREAAETKLADEVTKRKDAEKNVQLEKDAHTLAANKLADEVTAHNETKDKLAAASSSDDLEAKMLAVFPGLTSDDFKTDGVPTVKSVEEALGVDVSADQVAAAWAKYQEGK